MGKLFYLQNFILSFYLLIVLIAFSIQARLSFESCGTIPIVRAEMRFFAISLIFKINSVQNSYSFDSLISINCSTCTIMKPLFPFPTEL